MSHCWAAVRPEILSTVRPTRLRLAGFLALVVGAVLAGVGAILAWAAVGFPGDDRLDVDWHGVDVWEGKAVLAIAVVTLLGMVLLRLLGTVGGRRALAAAIVAIGVVAAVLAIWDATRLDARFGGTGGLDEVAHNIADRLNLPYDRVRSQLRNELATQLEVTPGVGLWLAVAGGVVIAAGGTLSYAWAVRREVGAGVDAREPRDDLPDAERRD